MKYYIKLVTGFREEQHITIPMQEAHKAYYLFRHPEERGVFNDGLALIGKNIQEIRPDWNATMGWNDTHEIGDDDWNDIHQKEVDVKMKELLGKAKEAGMLVEQNPNLMKMSLGEIIVKQLVPNEVRKEISAEINMLADNSSKGDRQIT